VLLLGCARVHPQHRAPGRRCARGVCRRRSGCRRPRHAADRRL